ncbi:MAG: 4Fe-4S binding protein [Candidatus Lokiarchaeota archaeon]|nr:4Fe-4S binding protein [Candidatus Lokiarchaeota archaeon]
MPDLPKLSIFEKMRGIFTPVKNVRRQVLTEVARMIVEGHPPSYIETIPYNIISKDTPTYRESVFRERAIVRERARLAFGLDLKEFGAHGPIIDDVTPAMTDKKFLSRPIVNVIKAGCERCETDSFWVTNNCRKCMAHPCSIVCPVEAVTIGEKAAIIDQEKCIRCGRCAQACPYNAIVHRERPCAQACGVNAISSDENGFAEIDYEKCVSCGLCIVSCPFGAIGEKSEIVQIIYTLRGEKPVYVEIAPSFVGQFGPLVKPSMIIAALKQIGFAGVVEVAYGADVDTLILSRELADLVSKKTKDKRRYIGTSCCPAWVLAAITNFPKQAINISESFTPMVEAARKIKKMDPEARVVFLGPCIAKKNECFTPEVAELVDFVMTFEELGALFQAFSIDPSEMNVEEEISDASEVGRAYAVAGGVADAILAQTKEILGKEIDIPFTSADTLADCMMMLKNIQNSKISPRPLLVEGMACPYGCIGGPGTLSPLHRAKRKVETFSKRAKVKLPSQHLKE